MKCICVLCVRLGVEFVQLSQLLFPSIPLFTGIAYIAVQLVAAIAATAYLAAVFPKDPNANILGHIDNVARNMTVTIDATASVTKAFFMEATLTFILIYVIFATAFDTGKSG